MKPFAIEELIEAIREVMRTRGGTNVCFGSRLCKNVCCVICTARLWLR